MVKAELLVNGDTVTRGDGGFVDYYQILFDNHEFIFAEGIATESLTLDVATSPALPREVRTAWASPSRCGPFAIRSRSAKACWTARSRRTCCERASAL